MSLPANLLPHPDFPCAEALRVTAVVDVAAPPGELAIRYRVEGNPARLRMPLPGTARRRDELWQHSCFEAFLRPDASDNYYEFNFAPSGDWAAYRFGSRRGARTSPDLPAPRIAFRRLADACELSATVPLADLPELAGAAVLRAGLSAVIEGEDGRLTYWALAHGGAEPDFHDPAGFSLQVATR